MKIFAVSKKGEKGNTSEIEEEKNDARGEVSVVSKRTKKSIRKD